MTFKCERRYRWYCTDSTGKSWYAGAEYKYNGELAHPAPPTTPTIISFDIRSFDSRSFS